MLRPLRDCHCSIKKSALVCKSFMHLFNDLINQMEEGWEGLVGVFFQVIFNTLWSEANIYAAGIRRLLCICEAEQSARYFAAVPFSPLSTMAIDTSKCQAIIFPWLRRNVSGSICSGFFLCSCSPNIRVSSPRLKLIAACLGISACCNPTTKLVGF